MENRPKLDLDTIKKHMEECRIEEGSSNPSNLISETVGKTNLTLCHSLWQRHHRKQRTDLKSRHKMQKILRNRNVRKIHVLRRVTTSKVQLLRCWGIGHEGQPRLLLHDRIGGREFAATKQQRSAENKGEGLAAPRNKIRRSKFLGAFVLTTLLTMSNNCLLRQDLIHFSLVFQHHIPSPDTRCC